MAEALSPQQIAQIAYQAGFRGQALINAVAIALAESGGRPGARNPNGEDSRGLWQINVAPNVRKNKWGNLYDPVVNARAAFEISGGGENFQPWTTFSGATEHGRRASYSRHLQVAQQAARSVDPNAPVQAMSSGGVVVADETGEPVDDDGLASDASPEEIKAWVQENSPEFAYLLNNPEIMEVVVGWVRDDAPIGDLQARIRRTDYWQTHGPASRAFDKTLAEDPEAARRLIETTKIKIDLAARRQGLNYDDGFLGNFAKMYIRGGWNDQDLQGWLADELAKQQGLPAGEASYNADTVLAWARDLGLPLARKDAAAWALELLEGKQTEESIKSRLTNLAKGRWQNDPDIVRGLESGLTVSDLFSSHKAMIADLYGLDPDSVDVLNDPKWAEVTQFYDGEKKRSMTLGELGDWLRKRPEYEQSQEFEDIAVSIAAALPRAFGRKAA